eukprot:scaffold5276_cov134-Cylindrotheca_fusiformis.AAC.7
MIPNSGNEEWVAFAEDDDVGDAGFENVVRTTEPIRVAPNRQDSARMHKSDTSTTSSWMKKPIYADNTWAPVAPPETREPSSITKYRPPRNPATAHRKVQSVNSPKPTSSSDSSSDGVRRSRGTVVGAPSRRGRSSSRTRNQVAEKPSSRTRSSSRTRPPSRARSSSRSRGHSKGPQARSRSTSVQRKSRTSSRPPQTRRRSRSSSRSRPPVTTSTMVKPLSRQNSSRPPPSTSRTRGMIRANVPCSASVGPGVPKQNAMSSPSASQGGCFDDNASFKSFDVNIGRDITFGRTRSARSVTSNGIGKRPHIIEKLFGDEVSQEAKQAYLPRREVSPKNGGNSVGASAATSTRPEQIHSRILLTATVYHNTATNLWIATINTNQKGVSKNPATASKYLKAFSFSSESEARESAIANAPPKMLPFPENPQCFICNGKFAMFRRASHCRNCGVCVCNSCSTMWSCKMIPDTYNLKKEAQVKICKSCNFMSVSFKKALLAGDYEEAIALYGSGNINLRVPFPVVSKKGEIVYPIHCAVQGGNIDIVRWLIEDHFCPIKVVKTSKQKKGRRSETMIRTSKDRSVLSIALSGLHVEILRYLVVDCGVSIHEATDLKSTLRALEAILHAMPVHNEEIQHDTVVHRWDDTSFDAGMSVASSLGVDMSRADDASFCSKRQGEACILCCENSIDCVMTPCGHQMCCLKCSRNLQACPVCNTKGNFIKIFRP